MCAIHKKADVTFLLRNKNVTSLSESEIIIYDNFGHKKTALQEAKLFRMLFISVFKFCHECAKPCTES